MGFRLYVEEKETGKDVWCGGKCYGYCQANLQNFKGARYLYDTVNDFREDVDEFVKGSVVLRNKTFQDVMEDFFDCTTYLEIEVSGLQLLSFYIFYEQDRHELWGCYDEEDFNIEVSGEKTYLLKWF